MRTAFAYIRATATGDDEAVKVLVEGVEMGDLAEVLAQLVTVFILALHEDPLTHIDLMFEALGVHRAGDEEENRRRPTVTEPITPMTTEPPPPLTGAEALRQIQARQEKYNREEESTDD